MASDQAGVSFPSRTFRIMAPGSTSTLNDSLVLIDAVSPSQINFYDIWGAHNFLVLSGYWTPSMPGYTFGIGAASYYRVGNLVFVTVYLFDIHKNSPAPANMFSISGLPFPSENLASLNVGFGNLSEAFSSLVANPGEMHVMASGAAVVFAKQSQYLFNSDFLGSYNYSTIISGAYKTSA